MGTLVPLLTNTAAIDQGWPISRGAEAWGAQIPQGARSLEAPLEFPRRQLWCRFHSNVKHFIFEVKISLSIFFLYLAACKFQAAASDAPHYVWQYFAVTNMLMLRKAGPGMLLSVILWQKVQGTKHFQSSSTYLRACCLGPTQSRPSPIRCDQQKDDEVVHS